MKKHWLAVAVLIAAVSTGGIGSNKKGPEIQVIDNKLSVQAEAVPLGRLLRLLDQATGLHSTVPAELANRNVSARFSGLAFDEAVRKIFEGVAIDYVFVQGQGIVVTAASQTLSASDQPSSLPPPNMVQPMPAEQPAIAEQPFFPPPGAPQPAGAAGFAPGGQPFPGAAPQNPFQQQQQQMQQQQPAVIQTPFGPIPNPRANQPAPPNGTPLTAPGQQPFGIQSPMGVSPDATNGPLFGSGAPNQLGMPSSTLGTNPGLPQTQQQNPLAPRKP